MQNFIGNISNYMSYTTTRRDLISNNIANANTPSYKAKDAAFVELLETGGQTVSGTLSLMKTNDKHLAMNELTKPTANIYTKSGEVNASGNNVDVTAEMVEMVKNNYVYNVAVQTLNTEYTISQAARGK